ncbi:hypothetical protein Cgig2_009833 [Carnegiea gigantea]|uniref:Uncharacterized protein n=1 Tax=Carnegiea gigantea TaxID=171969 RepID=A0A9Q1QL93_9CARY|nr:hypothetical protein Cgig2_009833 [Carnegiea gigantea]
MSCTKFFNVFLPKMRQDIMFCRHIGETNDFFDSALKFAALPMTASATLGIARILEYLNEVNSILLVHVGHINNKFVKEFTLSQKAYGIRKLLSSMFSSVEFRHLKHSTLINCSLVSLSTIFQEFPCCISLQLLMHVGHSKDRSYRTLRSRERLQISQLKRYRQLSNSELAF